jgi:hypothetical protein
MWITPFASCVCSGLIFCAFWSTPTLAGDGDRLASHQDVQVSVDVLDVALLAQHRQPGGLHPRGRITRRVPRRVRRATRRDVHGGRGDPGLRRTSGRGLIAAGRDDRKGDSDNDLDGHNTRSEDDQQATPLLGTRCLRPNAWSSASPEARLATETRAGRRIVKGISEM